MALNQDFLKKSLGLKTFSTTTIEPSTPITPLIQPTASPITAKVGNLNLPIGPLNPVKTYTPKSFTPPPKESPYKNISYGELWGESFNKGVLRLGSGVETILSIGAKKIGAEQISKKLETLAKQDKDLSESGINIVDERKFSEKVKDPKWITSSIAENIPSMLFGMGAAIPAAVIGAPAAVIGATTFVGTFAQEAGAAYQEAKDYGADDKTSEKVAGLVGVANGILEALPITKLFSRSPIGKKVKSQILKKITKRVTTQALSEGSTESLQEIVLNTAAKYYDENRDVLRGVPESAFLGAVMGGGVSAVADIPSLVPETKARPGFAKIPFGKEKGPEEPIKQGNLNLPPIPQETEKITIPGEITPVTESIKPITEIDGQKIKVPTTKTAYSKDKIIIGEYNGKPYTTDTFIIEFENLGLSPTDIQAPTSEMIQSIISRTDGAKSLGQPTSYVILDGSHKLIFSAKTGQVIIDSKYYNYLAKKYSNLDLRSTGKNAPVAIYNNGEFKGLVMPIDSEGIKNIKSLKKSAPYNKAQVPAPLPRKTEEVAPPNEIIPITAPLYHGTDLEIKDGLEPTIDPAASYGQGIYLTDNPKIAKEYGKNVIPIYPTAPIKPRLITELERENLLDLFGKKQKDYIDSLLGKEYNALKIPERAGDGFEIVVYDKNLIKTTPSAPPAREEVKPKYKTLLEELKKNDELLTISKTSGKENLVKFISSDDKGVMAIEPNSGLTMRFRHELFDFKKPEVSEKIKPIIEPMTIGVPKNIIEDIPEENLAEAEQFWEDNYSEKYGEISNQVSELSKNLKETPKKQIPAIQKQIDDLNNQLGQIEEDFIKKMSDKKPIEKKPQPEIIKIPNIEFLPQDKEVTEDSFVQWLSEGEIKNKEELAAAEAEKAKTPEEIPSFSDAEYVAATRESLIFNNSEVESNYHLFKNRYSKFSTKVPEDVVQFKERVPESKNWFYSQDSDTYDSDIFDQFVARYNAEKTADKILELSKQTRRVTKKEVRAIDKEVMKKLRAIYMSRIKLIKEKGNELIKAVRAREALKREELIARGARQKELSALKERIIARYKISRIETALQILQRRRAFVKAVQRQFGLSDTDIKTITKRDIRLMTDYEFSGFLEDLRKKSEELATWTQAKNELIQQIRDKQLNIETLRQAMELPQIKDMTLGQLEQFDKTLKPYQFGDRFLSKRMLETIERTEIKGAKTYREVREHLAKKLNVSEVTDESFPTDRDIDKYLGHAGLAEKNPFFQMVVESTTKLKLIREAEYLEIEKKTNEVAKKFETTLKEKIIPGQKNIVKWFNASNKDTVQLTPAEAEIVKIIQEELGKARDYLIENEAMERGIKSDYYYPHARRGFLEATVSDGLKTAWSELMQKYKLEEKAFNILDTETGEILALDKFFANTLHRVKNKEYALIPTENVIGAFLGYMKKFKLKQALDEITPTLYIYTQALTPKGLTKTGLPIHNRLMRFMKEWLNTQKGRHITLLFKQGGQFDLGIRAIKSFTSLMDIGLSIPVSVASQIGEQVTTFQVLGNVDFVKAKIRSFTPRGRRIIIKYRNFIGKNPWGELIEPAKNIGNRLYQGIFILFRDATMRRQKNILLGSMTDSEWASETITSERLSQIKINAARWTVQEGTGSIFGATPEASLLTQYKKWAIPIISSNARNLKYIVKYLKSLGKEESPRAKRAVIETLRIIEIGLITLTAGAMFIDDDDDSLTGKLKKRMYQEAMTIFGAFGSIFAAPAPRLVGLIEDLAKAFGSLFKWEKYEQTRFGEYKAGELKAGKKFLDIITPRAIKQFETVPEKQLKDVKKEILDDIKSGRLTIPAAKTKLINEMKKIQTKEKQKRFKLSSSEYKTDLKKRILSKQITLQDAKEEFVEYAKKNADSFKAGDKKLFISKFILYAKAIGTDPITAFEDIFGGENIIRIDNGAIIVERMPVEESQRIKKNLGAGKELILDHRISLQLGGTNDEDNLQLISVEEWASYTPVENYLGAKLRAGLIDKKTAQRLIREFKEGKITEKNIRGY